MMLKSSLERRPSRRRFVLFRPVFLSLICLIAVGGRSQAADDFSSQALTTKAWDSLGAGELATALEATAKCRELYAAEAERQQAGLEDFLPADKGHDAWALNDVGTCLFIEGQVHEKAGRVAEARAAYQKLVDAFGFAQCWDQKGWFWKPAQAAADRLEVLEFDATLSN